MPSPTQACREAGSLQARARAHRARASSSSRRTARRRASRAARCQSPRWPACPPPAGASAGSPLRARASRARQRRWQSLGSLACVRARQRPGLPGSPLRARLHMLSIGATPMRNRQGSDAQHEAACSACSNTHIVDGDRTSAGVDRWQHVVPNGPSPTFQALSEHGTPAAARAQHEGRSVADPAATCRRGQSPPRASLPRTRRCRAPRTPCAARRAAGSPARHEHLS